MTDFSGRVVRLTYDANGDLVSITTPAVTGTPNGNDFPQGKTTRFAYTSGFSDQRLNHNLTTIIAPNEVADGSLTPRTINTYGADGLAFDRVTSQSWGGGRSNASGIPAGGEVTLAYSTAIEPAAPLGAHSKTTITDRGGNVLELWHDGAGHRLADRQVVAGQPLVTGYTYNADGLLTSVTYPAGNRIEYRYDDGAANRLAQRQPAGDAPGGRCGTRVRRARRRALPGPGHDLHLRPGLPADQDDHRPARGHDELRLRRPRQPDAGGVPERDRRPSRAAERR